MNQATYSIPHDLIKEIVDTLSANGTYSDGEESYNNDDVIEVREKLEALIHEQDSQRATESHITLTFPSAQWEEIMQALKAHDDTAVAQAIFHARRHQLRAP